MACGQSHCGQNVPPCGHCEPSSLPAHPGITPPAGQNGPAVKHAESFSSPFYCLFRRPGDATAHTYFHLFLRPGDTRAHADFRLFPPPALATAHTYFHLFQRHITNGMHTQRPLPCDGATVGKRYGRCKRKVARNGTARNEQLMEHNG